MWWTIVAPPVGRRTRVRSGFVCRHEVDSRSVEVEAFFAGTSARATAQPDDADDAGVAVDHDDGRYDEDVRRQEREVGFALPLGRVPGALTRQRRPQRAVVASSRVNFFHLDEDEELWCGEDESAQPAGQHLEPDALRAGERAQRMYQHLHQTNTNKPRHTVDLKAEVLSTVQS